MDLLNRTLAHKMLSHSSTAPTPSHASPRNDLTMDFTTAAGKHLCVRMPLTVFDQLSLHLGNAYKANCWVTVRCSEVESLSIEAIERYVNMMARTVLGQRRSLTIAPRIEVLLASGLALPYHLED